MKVGDLVRNLNSEGGLLGIIVGWQLNYYGLSDPVVFWKDGRKSWIRVDRVEVVCEGR